jgi:hypothetical protein
VFHSYRTKRFNELLAALPTDAQHQAREAYELFKENPRHGSLQFKCVDPSAKPPWYSVRIGAHYRALGALDGDTIIWFWIGTHQAYDKLIP